MFIELHRLEGTVITINLNSIEFFAPLHDGTHTLISVPDYNNWLQVEESYEQVKKFVRYNMFIELHKLEDTVITINLNSIELFAPLYDGTHTMISVPDYNNWLQVEESYEQVKELLKECQKK